MNCSKRIYNNKEIQIIMNNNKITLNILKIPVNYFGKCIFPEIID